MSDVQPTGPWGRFLSRPNDDPVKTMGVAGLTALAAALTVSAAAVWLEPYQRAHIEAERAAQMAAMLDTLPDLRAVMEAAGVTALDTRTVDLAADGFAPELDPGALDIAAAVDLPDLSEPLPPDADVAGLGRVPLHAPVHLLARDGRVALVVLPMVGTGYQSRIEALLALEADLNTVAALVITAQADTPGLGARITEPEWQGLWPGKEIAGPEGEIRISVVRGEADGPYEVDGISGATRTSQGVGAMVRFWMGEWGYGPFLERLEREGIE
ncbi:FMN-binding protein [Rhodobacteraceae bacterium CCMM004]|nr:FMN-binding protein [Rhodobacteraceae bacterium CCMM004]